MRDTFISELTSLAEKNKKIVLVVGDLGYGVVEQFQDKFPDRFFNAGVAEQNMMGLSAGLASEGFHVFVYSIANFPIFRCAEQIRNDVDYHNLPVTIVSVGGGLAYGNLGYSHHAIQDYGFLRALPNFTVCSPGDPLETIASLKYLVDNPQPSYLRLGRNKEPNFNNNQISINPGNLNFISKKHKDKLILSTGTILDFAYNFFKDNSIEYDIATIPAWGMKYKKTFASQISSYSEIVVFEEHLKDSGFGSWCLEALNDGSNNRIKLNIKALHPSVCGAVGSREFLIKKCFF